ncbi:MAG: hypothetical protein K2M64_00500 [Clostridia bacterium]|nr:hypothetical protein [Clostridia bacterium]
MQVLYITYKKKFATGDSKLTIGIIDDNVGIFATYYKLRQVVKANFVCQITDKSFPLAKLNVPTLYDVGKRAIDSLIAKGADVIVLSNATIGALCYKRLAEYSTVQLYSLEAPVLHAATYTASGVLVCVDNPRIFRQTVSNVRVCVMEDFAALSQNASERQITQYIEERIAEVDFNFDCLALSSSSMNLYKHCFCRVCPNVRVFDSLDGVARKIRKKYKKMSNDESTCVVLDEFGTDITQNYDIFLE